MRSSGMTSLKTLSEHGTVNRGVCTLDAKGNLASITERINISEKTERLFVRTTRNPGTARTTSVSMNFGVFIPHFDSYRKGFPGIPGCQCSGTRRRNSLFRSADRFIREGGTVEVIPTAAEWFGVTYKEDAPAVQQSLNALIARGEYPERLWS